MNTPICTDSYTAKLVERILVLTLEILTSPLNPSGDGPTVEDLEDGLGGYSRLEISDAIEQNGTLFFLSNRYPPRVELTTMGVLLAKVLSSVKE